MRTKFLCGIILSAVVSACSADKDMMDDHVQDDAIFSIISDFKSNLTTETRSDNYFQILDVKTKYYRMENDSIMETIPTKADDDVFDIKTVSLRFKESEGFAIISTDERIRQVFYYTETGTLSDSASIPPLKWLIDESPYYAAEMLREKHLSRSVDETVIVKILVRVKWGQGFPYNGYAPSCNCSFCSNRGWHNPTGCVTTAVAQLIATTDKFKGTFYGSKNIDFNTFPACYSLMDIYPHHQQIAHFFHEIALNCQVKYSCTGTDATLKAAANYLKDMGYNCEHVSGNLDSQKVIAELQKGYPHLIGGGGPSGNHAWLIDGVKLYNGSYSYHCNWGTDGDNGGWCVAPTFQANENHLYNRDFQHVYINSIN